MTKLCKTCGIVKDASEYSPKPAARDGLWTECRDCARNRRKLNARLIRAADPDGERIKRKMARYGLTPKDYDDLYVAQQGGCAVCGRGESGASHYDELCVDHCHRCGQVRGLLCSNCNSAIGLLGDDCDRIAAAFAYVIVHKLTQRALPEQAQSFVRRRV